MKLSLALIVAPTKAEAQKLNNCLASVAPHVDELCITVTGDSLDVEKVAKKYNATLSRFEWVDDFAKARNFNFAQCTGDWILWLDADDVMVGVDKLKKHIDIAETVAVNGLQMFYEYGHDEFGAVIDGHWKTQLVKNDGSVHWVGVIHEDLIQKRVCNWAQLNKEDMRRVHTATKEENNSHFARNLNILERESTENPDEPRTYIYLGRTYLGMGRYEDALKALSKFTTISGWDEERYEAKCLMGECYEKLGLKKEALLAFSDALLEDERCPKAYVLKARVYFSEEKYEEALTLLHIAKSLPKPKPGIMHLPTFLGRDLYMMASVCSLNLGRIEDAHRLAQLAEKEAPNNSHVQELINVTQKMNDDESMTKTFHALLKWYAKYDAENVEKLYALIPSDIKDDPRLLSIGNAPKKWGEKSIVVYCGQSAEDWLPGNENTKGIGGSETAVIELTRRLVAQGWQVTVYNQCGAGADGVVIDGVNYQNYWKFNKDDQFDVLWLWRMPSMLQWKWNARKVILDLHDVPNPNEFTTERLQNVDKIFVKTKYHRSLLPDVPDEKFVVVGNGINLDRFYQEALRQCPYCKNTKSKCDLMECRKLPWSDDSANLCYPQQYGFYCNACRGIFNLHMKRDAKKIIYSSAPNRGLEYILDHWATIRKEVPDAELHVFYGWETYYVMQKDNPVAMEWMQSMKLKMNQEGVINHGRVGQKELAKEMLSSSIWFYPTDFEEIDCITAREMQAAGVLPITTGFAALAETQVTGIKDENKENLLKEVIHSLTTDIEHDEIKSAAKSFSWDEVVKIWNYELR